MFSIKSPGWTCPKSGRTGFMVSLVPLHFIEDIGAGMFFYSINCHEIIHEIPITIVLWPGRNIPGQPHDSMELKDCQTIFPHCIPLLHTEKIAQQIQLKHLFVLQFKIHQLSLVNCVSQGSTCIVSEFDGCKLL